jgi:hypothetical protein
MRCSPSPSPLIVEIKVPGSPQGSHGYDGLNAAMTAQWREHLALLLCYGVIGACRLHTMMLRYGLAARVQIAAIPLTFVPSRAGVAIALMCVAFFLIPQPYVEAGPEIEERRAG